MGRKKRGWRSSNIVGAIIKILDNSDTHGKHSRRHILEILCDTTLKQIANRKGIESEPDTKSLIDSILNHYQKGE